MSSTDLHPPTPTPPQSSSTPLGLPPTTTPHALTSHDSNILSLLFSSESSSATPVQPHSTIHIDASLPPDPHVPAKVLPVLKQREMHAILEAEKAVQGGGGGDTEGVKMRTLENALKTLDELIKEYPEYASAYVNRAQVRRLVLLYAPQPDTTSMTPPTAAAAAAGITAQPPAPPLLLPTNPTCTLIESDLLRSLSLLTPPTSTPTITISPQTKHLLLTTHTHLATLYLHYSKSVLSRQIASDAGLSGGATGSAHWEEKASREFDMAGRYGSEVGRKMGVWTNPWAKACGGVVREALRREIEGGEEGEEGEDGEDGEDGERME